MTRSTHAARSSHLTLLASLAIAAVTAAPALADRRATPEPAFPTDQSQVDERYLDDDRDTAIAALHRSAVGYRLPDLSAAGAEWVGRTAREATPSIGEGRIVVIQTWNHADPRQRTLPLQVHRLIEASDAEGVSFVALHTPTAADSLPRYIERRDLPYAVALDREGHWLDTLGAFERPTTIVADEDGRVRLAGANPLAVARIVRELARESSEARAELGEPKPLPPRDDRVAMILAETRAAGASPDQAERLAYDLAAKQFNPPDDLEEPAAAPGATDDASVAEGLEDLARELGNRLRTADGGFVETEQRLAGKKAVLLYNSAAWCGPCRAFTPKLVEFYEQNGGGDTFEVVLVSHDRSAREAIEYLTDYEMPWTLADTRRNGALAKYRSGRGIPDLILIDASTGRTVMGSYRDDGSFQGPSAVLAETQRFLNN